MDPRLSIVCLGVEDLNKSYDFYSKLGFESSKKPEDGIIFFRSKGVCLGLYPYDSLAEDVGEKFKVPRSKFAGITLAHNVRTREEVDKVLAEAKNAGAHIEKPAQDTFWGGYSGYFSDPDGYLWEVAWGAFEFNEDDSLIIP